MQAVDIISAKRDGRSLTAEEMAYMVRRYNRGALPDYQMAAFLMALYIRGMDSRELTCYTSALVHSGKIMEWGDLNGAVMDKHSSGGVGDKTTLVVAPLAASAGLYMPKMSGRGLGHTGGTVDKLESIPGFKTDLSEESFRKQVREIGLAVISQTGELAPADGKIYALRDVTATVESIPLIAASIMSKKLAGGARVVVLDVKTGRGAFMDTVEKAQTLARTMTDLGESMGRKTVAVISDMNQPLGRRIGNFLEVQEAVEVLKGEGPAEVRELSLVLAAKLLVAAGRAEKMEDACIRLESQLDRGGAWEKFKEMVEHQGGDSSSLEKTVPRSYLVQTVCSPEKGYLSGMDALYLGRAAALLGAGRFRKGDEVDPFAGLVLHAKIGDGVEKGEPLVSLYSSRRRSSWSDAETPVKQSLTISREKVSPPPLIYNFHWQLNA